MSAAAAAVVVVVGWVVHRRPFCGGAKRDEMVISSSRRTSKILCPPPALGSHRWNGQSKFRPMFNGNNNNQQQQNEANGGSGGGVRRSTSRRPRTVNNGSEEAERYGGGRKRARMDASSNSTIIGRGGANWQSNERAAMFNDTNNTLPYCNTTTTNRSVSNPLGGGTSESASLDLELLLTPTQQDTSAPRALLGSNDGTGNAVVTVGQPISNVDGPLVADVTYLGSNNNTNLNTRLPRASEGEGRRDGGSFASPMARNSGTAQVSSSSGGGAMGTQNERGQNGVQKFGVEMIGDSSGRGNDAVWCEQSNDHTNNSIISSGCVGPLFGMNQGSSQSSQVPMQCGGSVVGPVAPFYGINTLPADVRAAIGQIHSRQLKKMIAASPAFADIVPPLSANGMSNLAFLLLEWQADMVLPRLVGFVVMAGSFTTLAGLTGFDVRLIFDKDCPQNELAIHCWTDCVDRIASTVQCGQVVEFTRLKVRPQAKNGKGSFPFTCLYNGESRHRIVAMAPHTAVNNVSTITASANATPVIEETTGADHHHPALSSMTATNDGSITIGGPSSSVSTAAAYNNHNTNNYNNNNNNQKGPAANVRNEAESKNGEHHRAANSDDDDDDDDEDETDDANNSENEAQNGTGDFDINETVSGQ